MNNGKEGDDRSENAEEQCLKSCIFTWVFTYEGKNHKRESGMVEFSSSQVECMW